SSFSDQTQVGDYRHVRFDAVSSATIDADGPPPSRGVARNNFCCDQLEDGPLSIIQRVTQTINFVLHISQALVGRAQLSVFHLKYSILVFELIEGLQAGTHGCDLLLYPRTAGQKWRQQLVHARLELLRRLRPEAEKIPQNSAKDQHRDNTCTD